MSQTVAHTSQGISLSVVGINYKKADLQTRGQFGFGDGKDHIMSHLEESYYVPSLLLNAINETPVSMMADHILHCIWQGDEEHDIPSMHSLAKQQIGKSLSRYIRLQLGMA